MTKDQAMCSGVHWVFSSGGGGGGGEGGCWGGSVLHHVGGWGWEGEVPFLCGVQKL